MRPLRSPAALLAALLLTLTCGTSAHAATWAEWWLPQDFSKHGRDVDWLFYVIFWITMFIFVAVEIVLVYFAIRYRFRATRKKGIFSHGNTKLEMAWTIVPAIILIWISLASAKVWDDFRYDAANEGNRTKVMVIAQQFKWNFIYPGPDGQFGRYLAYPRPSDARFAHRPARQAEEQVKAEVLANPLGQRLDSANPNDPGLDDDTVPQPGRPLIVPRDRPLDITLGSRDVLHSFFLPNFRVKLDAVPGLRGHIYFTAKKQSTQTASIDTVPADKTVWLDSATPKAFLFGNPPSFQVFDPKVIAPDAPDPYAVDPNTLDVAKLTTLTGARSRDMAKRKRPWLQSLQSTLRDAAVRRLEETSRDAEGNITFDATTAPAGAIDAEIAALRQDLKKMGMTELSYIEHTFEIVCEELCGDGHSQMTGQMIVVSPEQYDRFIHKKPPAGATASAEEGETP